MTVVPLCGLFYFCIFPSNHLLGLFSNVMKICAALIYVLGIFHLQFNISDDIGIVSIIINSIIIIINKIILFFILLFLKNILIITKYVTSITNIRSLWLNNSLWGFIAPAPPKISLAQTIQSCWSFILGCIKCSWFIFRWCGITCHA